MHHGPVSSWEFQSFANEMREFMTEVRSRLSGIEYKLGLTLKGELVMAIDLSALQAEVAKQTTIVASVQSFVAGLNAQLSALQSQTSDSATATALAGIQAQLAANDTALANAIAANTTPTP